LIGGLFPALGDEGEDLGLGSSSLLVEKEKEMKKKEKKEKGFVKRSEEEGGVRVRSQRGRGLEGPEEDVVNSLLRSLDSLGGEGGAHLSKDETGLGLGHRDNRKGLGLGQRRIGRVRPRPIPIFRSPSITTKDDDDD